MEPFVRIEAAAAAIRGSNVDTDQILPARFLPKPRAGGFAQYLFHDLRFDADGAERPDFVLNRPGFRDARILVGEVNFGCGSSRENAVWAVADYGIRVVVAASLGDIFRSNCIQNGVLPVTLDAELVACIVDDVLTRQGSRMAVDLERQTVTDPRGMVHRFEIDAFSRHCLMNGVDELDYTLSQIGRIDAFARARAAEEGWPAPVPRGADT